MEQEFNNLMVFLKDIHKNKMEKLKEYKARMISMTRDDKGSNKGAEHVAWAGRNGKVRC